MHTAGEFEGIQPLDGRNFRINGDGEFGRVGLEIALLCVWVCSPFQRDGEIFNWHPGWHFQLRCSIGISDAESDAKAGKRDEAPIPHDVEILRGAFNANGPGGDDRRDASEMQQLLTGIRIGVELQVGRLDGEITAEIQLQLIYREVKIG